MLEPGEIYSPDPNILERKAARYLSRLSEGAGFQREHASADAGELRRLTRSAVTLAATAGIAAGVIIGGTEWWMVQAVFNGNEGVDWREQWPWWAAFFAFAGLISAIEIVFLYWVALRGIAGVTSRSGLALGDAGYPDLFARSLARGGLEFPNPRVLVFGINPYAYMPLWKLAAKNIAYKLKVGVTSFLLRVFLRRVMVRMTIRSVVPLAAGPLYAGWNAIIMWRIMREARIRTLAPFAVESLVRQMFGAGQKPGKHAAEVMLQAAGEMLRRAGDAHPNQVFLLSRLREELGVTDDIDVDWTRHGGAMQSLDEAEQKQILNVLTLSIIIGSRISRRQKDLLREACEACGVKFGENELEQLRTDLMEGRAIAVADLAKAQR
jgi:hypothetical protein